MDDEAALWILRHVDVGSEDSLNFGRGDTAFTAGCGDKADLPEGYPASNRSGIYAEERSCLARSEEMIVFHVLIVKGMADIKGNNAIARFLAVDIKAASNPTQAHRWKD